jgi:hypothetical protein
MQKETKMSKDSKSKRRPRRPQIPTLPFELHFRGRSYFPQITDEQAAAGLVAAVVEEHFLKNYRWLDSLQTSLRDLGNELAALEKTYGHDDTIPANIWHEAGGEAFYGWVMPLSELEHHMIDSLKLLERVHKQIKGRYRGELKDKSEERLTRHISTGESLLNGLRELKSAEHAPPRLFEFRYRRLVQMLQDYSVFVDKAIEMRRVLKDSCFTPSLFKQLSVLTEPLLELRSSLQKLRDNPRQEMSAILLKHAAQLEKLHTGWKRLQGDASFRATLLQRRATD